MRKEAEAPGVVERNVYLVKRLRLVGGWVLRLHRREFYTHRANCPMGIQTNGGRLDVNRVTTTVSSCRRGGTSARSSSVFLPHRHVAWERWEGKDE